MRGKKLRGNGMWESSRMIIPQHKEAIVEHRRNLGARERPELDEQRLEELSTAIAEARESGALTAVTTFGKFEDEVHIGVVEKVDPFRRLLKLVSDGETVWIPFADIFKIERA